MGRLAILFDNPIFVRELRRRLRAKGVIVSLVAYIVMMCGVSVVLIYTNALAAGAAAQAAVVGQRIGTSIFMAVSVIQAFLVWLAAPSIAAGVTTSERDRQTFEFLQVTTLSPRGFVIGNLLSTLMYVLLVLMCALPVISVAFLYGGVAIDDVATTFSILLLVSMTLTSFSLFASSIFSKTRGVQALVTAVCIGLGFTFIVRRWIFSGFLMLGGKPIFQIVYPLFGFKVPMWLPVTLGVLLFCYALVVAAGRKLYNPDNRLYSYRQFLVFFILLQAFHVAAAAGSGPFSARAALPWMLTTGLLLLLAGLLFSTGRAGPGDEVWEIRRRWKALRVIDEALLYYLVLCALALAGGAALAAWMQPHGAKGLWTSPQVNVAISALAYMSALGLFVFSLGRLVSQLTHTRQSAFFALAGVSGGLLIAFPLVVNLIAQIAGTETPDEINWLLPLAPLTFIGGKLDDLPAIAMAAFLGIACIPVMALWVAASRRHPAAQYTFKPARETPLEAGAR